MTIERADIGRFLQAVFVDKVPRDHQQIDAMFMRRRVVAALTIVVGATLLGMSLRLPPGDGRFYPLTLVNGLSEELFFRGALFAAIGRRYPVVISTVIYTLATVAAGNVMLVFAAAALGALVGVQRSITGGVLAPMITHVTWSVSLLFVLPPLITAVS